MPSRSDGNSLQAVVIGSGFAGLSAAAGLSKLFDNVVLLDKDDFKLGLSRDEVADPHKWHEEYEAEIKRRQGVSQYRQPHVMLVKGLQELEALFPGYTSQLLAAGAVPVDVVGNWSLHDWGQHGNRPDHDFGQKSVCASRHLYENIARGFVLKISNVAVKTAAAVKTLKFDAATARGTGVVLKNGDSIAADLVVDASGGNTRVNKWLQDIGHPVPPPHVVDAGLQYTCRMYDRTGRSDRDTDMVMVMNAPHYSVMSVRLPIELGKWQVVLVGYKGYQSPSAEAGFLNFARNLPSPEIYDSIKDAKPASAISPYTQTANVRRKFESVPPPSGLCVIGDACCRFNPVFGQGMSVGVMGSALLCRCVRESFASAGPSKQQKLAALHSLPANFHTQLNSMLEFPWTTSSGADAMKPNAKVEGAPKQKSNLFAKLQARYFALLGQARFTDAYLFEKMSAVQNMIAPPDTLLKLDIIGRALLYWLRSTFHL